MECKHVFEKVMFVMAIGPNGKETTHIKDICKDCGKTMSEIAREANVRYWKQQFDLRCADLTAARDELAAAQLRLKNCIGPIEHKALLDELAAERKGRDQSEAALRGLETLFEERTDNYYDCITEKRQAEAKIEILVETILQEQAEWVKAEAIFNDMKNCYNCDNDPCTDEYGHEEDCVEDDCNHLDYPKWIPARWLGTLGSKGGVTLHDFLMGRNP